MIKINKDMIEGVDFINISSYSDLKEGRRLAIGYPFAFSTVIGNVGSVRSAMDYVTTPNYPVKLLNKSKLTKYDVATIPKEKNGLPNYKAVLTYFIGMRILADKELQNDLSKLNPKIKVTSYNIINDPIVGKNIVYNENMGSYCGIISKIIKLLNNDDFNIKTLNELVTNHTKDTSVSLFHGSAVEIGI